MYFVTENLVLSVPLADAMLAALSTVPTAALLATPSIELFTNNTPPTPRSAWADFTKASFAGYAKAPVTISGVGNLMNDDQGALAHVLFKATAAISGPELCYGYILSDGLGIFYAGELFPTALQFATAGDYLDIDLVIPISVRPVFNTR
jgi:hypothetical protein